LQLEIRPEAHSSYDDLATVLAIAQRNGFNDLRVLAARRDHQGSRAQIVRACEGSHPGLESTRSIREFQEGGEDPRMMPR
jgi:hypothetical protein